MEEKKVKVVDLVDVYKSILKNKKLFFKALPIAFVAACLIILSVPRYYVCEVKLAPEVSSIAGGNSLSNLASSFGIDMVSAVSVTGGDAIFPELYPDLMNSVDFTISLFPIKVSTKEGDVNTTYSDYLSNHTRSPWWSYIMASVKKLFEEKDTTRGRKGGIDPFMLTKSQMGLVQNVQGNIGCNIDKKNQVITISVTDQDPLVCAIMADSVKARLQDFITRYRTNKARNDLEFTKKLLAASKADYEKAQQTYAEFSDRNQGMILQSYLSKKEELENEMQLRFNTYNALSMQYQAAIAKVQERTPAFTILQGASVPVKPAGPKRMFFVLFVTFMTFVGLTLYVYLKK